MSSPRNPLEVLQALDADELAACPECTAACTFEAMHMCTLPPDRCPVLQRPPERFGGPNGAFEFLAKGEAPTCR